jgi:predicted O-methyltransferase YrrM
MNFTTDWFSVNAPMWERYVEKFKPRKILEVGCYEGRATTFLIERCPDASFTCVDTWEGAADLTKEAMNGVEDRFNKNTAEVLKGGQSLTKLKMKSTRALPMMLAEGKRFDFIYVDGSHTAPDVLTDAVDCFRLLEEGGLLIFDDYVWYMELPGQQDSLNMPKPAIDAFVNLFQRKLKLLHISNQLALTKVAC